MSTPRRLLASGLVAPLAVVGASACTPGSRVLAGAHHPHVAPRVVSSAVAPSSSPGPATATPAPSPPPAVVLVDGQSVAAARARTVALALGAAHVVVPSGQVRALVSRRALGSDGLAGHVLVNGHRARLATRLVAGDEVTVVAGPDRTETTRAEVIAVPAPNPSNLYVGGTPGRAAARVGVRSGEVAVGRLLVAPTLGHLVAPGAVALTFDDGPDPTWTPQVLALLAQAHVHATFCLIGKNAARYPQLVREIVAGGHVLCDHTWDHDEQIATRPLAQIRADIARAAATIKAAAGVVPAFFRAPGGDWSPTVEAEARRQHMTPLKWTVDPRDWSRPGVSAILHAVDAELRPGGIILMHDGGGDRSQSVAALKVLLGKLPAMGYHFVLPPAD